MKGGARFCVLVFLSMFGAASLIGAAGAATADPAPAAMPAATSAKAAAPAVADAPVKKPMSIAAKASKKKPPAADEKPTGAASVYLFRGFMGVFSLGMDELERKLDANGVKTKLLGHTQWAGVVKEIVAEYQRSPKGRYPIVLVGHSLGANAALMLAYKLGEQGVPVKLVLTVDPTVGRPLTPTVGRYLNIYQQNNGFGVALDVVGVSPKRVENYNIWDHANLKKEEITHFTLDKNDDIQQQMYDAIMKALRR